MKYFRIFNSADDTAGTDTTEPDNNTGNPGTDEQQEQAQEQPEEAKLTQAEVDTIVRDRLNRERQKYPGKDELKAFNEWKASQLTETERQAERDRQYQELEQKNKNLEIEAAALRAGIPDNLLKYAMVDIAGAEDIASGIEVFKQSELFKNTQQPLVNNFGAKGVKGNPGASPEKEKEDILAAAKAAMGIK